MSEQVVVSAPTRPREKPEMPEFFRHLCIVECAIVWLLGTAFLGLSIHMIGWICFGWGEEIHARIVETIRGMNEGWKVCLIILVPLFFRPIYKFLIHLKEGPFGTKSEKPARSEGVPKTEEYLKPKDQ
jgi:hypothetical protein